MKDGIDKNQEIETMIEEIEKKGIEMIGEAQREASLISASLENIIGTKRREQLIKITILRSLLRI